jgi:hypothetical protein
VPVATPADPKDAFRRKRGPKPDVESHEKVVRIVNVARYRRALPRKYPTMLKALRGPTRNIARLEIPKNYAVALQDTGRVPHFTL